MAYTTHDLKNVLIVAFEGGSNYWIEGVKWNGYEAFEKGDKIEIHAEEMGKYELDIKKLRKGVSMFRKCWEDPNYKGINYKGWKWESLNSGSYDADDCDAMLQFALFGEIVYG